MSDPSEKVKSDGIRRNSDAGTPDNRRAYTPPRVLSAEPLEVMAVNCDDPTPSGAGKSFATGCGTINPLGS